ncbi:MAG TPA: SPOR domain-containing protein [Woeseiaceae bacterium]
MPHRRKKRSSHSTGNGISPLAAMLFGLAVGLSVAVAVWVNNSRDAAPPRSANAKPAAEPASMQSALDDNDGSSDDNKGKAGKQRFTFYDILPNFEVVTPEQEASQTATPAAPQAIVEPGVYILQAGSFSTHEDADRRRAELALHGIESHIQRVTVNGRNYHRVYIGPTEDLDELNMLRSRLRAAKIDVLRIRMSD